MKEATAWKVSIVTPSHGSWEETFTFEPNRHQLLAAIKGDIEDRVQALERYAYRGPPNRVAYYTERLRQVKDVAVYARFDFAATQLCQRITASGVNIGTIQATRERVFTP